MAIILALDIQVVFRMILAYILTALLVLEDIPE